MFLLSLLTLGAAVASTSRRPNRALAARLGLVGLGDREEKGPGGGVEVINRPRLEVQDAPPRMYRVILYNDPRMGGEVVAEALTRFFRKTLPEAMRIMLTAHQGGQASVGIYTREVAETRIEEATTWSRGQMLALGFRNEMRLEMVPEDR